jgi:hypothetical protein
VTGIYYYAQLLAEMGSYKLFAQAGLRTTVLPISASLVAGITDVNHFSQPNLIFYKFPGTEYKQLGIVTLSGYEMSKKYFFII